MLVREVPDRSPKMRLDILLEVALALPGAFHLAAQDQLAAGPASHLDGQVLPLVGDDPGDLDQISLLAPAGWAGRDLHRVVDHGSEVKLGRRGRLADADGTEPDPVLDLAIEGGVWLGDLAVDGVNNQRGDPTVEGHQEALRAQLAAPDAERLPPAAH